MNLLNLIFAVFLFSQTECYDQLDCTEDIFDDGICKNILKQGYCLIDKTCYKTYEISANGCGICLPQKDQYNWSNNEVDDLECTIDKKDENGNCLHILKSGFCLIEHRCILDKTEDINGCRMCNSTLSPFEWTNYDEKTKCDDGLNCTKNDHCDGQGNCIGEEYSCDDKIECTVDICDGKGGCSNPLKNDFCYIDNECYRDLTGKPDNYCKYCNVLVDKYNWTNEVRGKKCNDGDPSTPFDYCDGKGNCIGYHTDPYADTGISLIDSSTDAQQDDGSNKSEIEREGCSCHFIY